MEDKYYKYEKMQALSDDSSNNDAVIGHLGTID